MPDDPSPASETPSEPDPALAKMSAELFGDEPPGPPTHEPPGDTLFDLADHSRSRRKRIILGVLIAIVLLAAATIIVLLVKDDESSSATPNALVTSVELFTCPGDKAPLMRLGEGELVLDAVDQTGEWVQVVEPVAGIGRVWARVDQITGEVPALPVAACGPEPADESVTDVLAEATTPTPAPTATPAATATPAPATPTPTPVPEPRPPGEVTVLVANGGIVAGAAGAATATLDQAGYITGVPRNADNRPRSQILFVPGYGDDAIAVAESLALDDPELIPLVGPAQTGFPIGAAQVVVILGSSDS